MNLDLYNPVGHPPASVLQGQKYVRLLADVSWETGNRDLSLFFQRYDPYINELKAAGLKVIFIFAQQTLGEAYVPNWNMTDAGWLKFFDDYVSFTHPIIQHFKGRVDAYEIWNEQDAPPNSDFAVTIQPHLYGVFFRKMRTMIKATDPTAKIITGGFMQGAGDIVNYLKAAGLGSYITDGLSVHPYGQGGVNTPEAYRPHGLIRDYMKILRNYTTFPIWITEFGILNVWPHPNIFIDYLISFKADCGTVEYLGLYAVRDGMHNACCAMDTAGNIKRHSITGQSAFDVLRVNTTTPPPTTPTTFTHRLTGVSSAGSNFREQPNTGAYIYRKVYNNQEVEVLNVAPQIIGIHTWRKLKINGQEGWLAVRGGGININLSLA